MVIMVMVEGHCGKNSYARIPIYIYLSPDSQKTPSDEQFGFKTVTLWRKKLNITECCALLILKKIASSNNATEEY